MHNPSCLEPQGSHRKRHRDLYIGSPSCVVRRLHLPKIFHIQLPFWPQRYWNCRTGVCRLVPGGYTIQMLISSCTATSSMGLSKLAREVLEAMVSTAAISNNGTTPKGKYQHCERA